MFRPIVTPSELPPVGTAEGTTLDFKAVVPPDWTGFRLARQIAAFANAMGGTLLIGAAEDTGTDRLKEYRPLSRDDTIRVEKRYGDAIRELCSPKPFVDLKPIAMDDGFVVAVNVWPFPGQPVGVRAHTDFESTGVDINAFVFSLRVGRDTTDIQPEQLPMFMLPEVRRAAILVGSIPNQSEVRITCQSQAPGEWKMQLMSFDVLTNALTLEEGDSSRLRITIPLDHVETVWKDTHGWHLHLRGRLGSKDGRLKYDVRARGSAPDHS